MAMSMRFLKICYFHEGCIFTDENMPFTPHVGLLLTGQPWVVAVFTFLYDILYNF